MDYSQRHRILSSVQYQLIGQQYYHRETNRKKLIEGTNQRTSEIKVVSPSKQQSTPPPTPNSISKLASRTTDSKPNAQMKDFFGRPIAN